MRKIRCDCREVVYFHGYQITRHGEVFGKSGQPLRKEERARRGGGFDLCVRLYYAGRSKKWTLSRLVAACFLGPIDDLQVNHIDRDPTNNHVNNLELVTPSENQKHWREDDAR